MEHERYAGISNLMLKSELAGGIGQIQTWLAPMRRKPFPPSTKIKCADLPVADLRHCWRRREDPSGTDRSFSVDPPGRSSLPEDILTPSSSVQGLAGSVATHAAREVARVSYRAK